jgi:hypothetical protein
MAFLPEHLQDQNLMESLEASPGRLSEILLEYKHPPDCHKTGFAGTDAGIRSPRSISGQQAVQELLREVGEGL